MGVGKSQKFFYFIWVKVAPGSKPHRLTDAYSIKEYAHMSANDLNRLSPTAKTWVECDVLNLEDDQRSKVL